MSEMRPSRATVTPDTHWMTYQEMAEHLGMKVESARRRAQREGWPRLPGNDGRARVGVPGDAVREDLSKTTDGGDGHPGEVATLREALIWERVARAEGERDALQGALRAAETAAEDAGRRARTADERAAAAHQRAAKVIAVLGRVAEGLEHLRQTQAAAAEAVAAAKAEREAVQARVEEATLRASEAEARAAEASWRAAAAARVDHFRFDHLQQPRAEAAAPDPAELEAAQARAAEAERQTAEARRQADEAERRATVASERLDRFQRARINKAQTDADRQGREAAERELAARKADGPLARVLRALRNRKV